MKKPFKIFFSVILLSVGAMLFSSCAASASLRVAADKKNHEKEKTEKAQN